MAIKNTKDKKQDPSQTSLAHDVMQARIDVINALMGGTETMRAAREVFLPKHPAEVQINYDERLQRSTLTNYFLRSVNSLVGKPFSNPIKIGDTMPEVLANLCDNIDHEGNSLDVFAKRCFTSGLSKGLTHILVEYPNTKENGAKTLADEKDINATPYFIRIEPENILAAYYENRAGQEFLTHVRIYETEIRRDGFSEILIERVRILEPGLWELWQKGDKRWEVIERGTTTLNYIPLITFYANKEEFMVANPPLIDLAWTNIAHWQSSSDQTNILTVARFPILAASGVTDEEVKQKIGPRTLLTSTDPQSKYYYLEHTGTAIESGRNDIRDREEQMAILGIELLKKSGDATATAKAIDSAENLSMLQALVMVFSAFLNTAFQIAGDWMGVTEEPGTIEINSDFGLSLNDASDLTSLQFARTNGDISREQFIIELQRRDVISGEYVAADDATLLAAESEKALQDQAFQHSLKQTGLLPPDNTGGQ